MPNTIISRVVDLSKLTKLDLLKGNLYTEDDSGDEFRVKVTRAGQSVDLESADVAAYFQRADGVTLKINGTVDSNEAVVDLDSRCYTVPGRFVLAIKATVGTIRHTIYACEGGVARSQTDTVYVPDGEMEPALEELLARIETMETQVTALKQSRVNLLDNSDWRTPVDPHGAGGTYEAWSGETIARWRVYNEATTITLSSAGISLKGRLYQIVNPYTGWAFGKTLTFAAKIGGTVYCCTGTVPDNTDYTLVASTNTPYGSIQITSQDGKILVVVSNNTNEATVEWVAMYEGTYTAATLHAYQPKGYAAELAECQRYCTKISNDSEEYMYIAKGTLYSPTLSRFALYLPTVMRSGVTATVTYSALRVFFYNEGTSTAYNVDWLIVSVEAGNIIDIRATHEELPFQIGSEVSLQLEPHGYIEILKDL